MILIRSPKFSSRPKQIPRSLSITATIISLRRFATTRVLQSTSDDIPTFKEQPRVNPVGIQYLSNHLDRQVFPSKYQTGTAIQSTEDPTLIELSKEYLASHKLLGKKTNISEPISFELPSLQGKNLDEHFRKLALFSSRDYLNQAKTLSNVKLPPKPDKFLLKSGWYRYQEGKYPTPVAYPEEDALVFDVETQYKVSHYPILGIAASEKAWYCWVSPIMTYESKSYEHLIPLNTVKDKKVIVGHNIGYDRARIKEEYELKETSAFYLDTMSLHIAVSGMCSQQRLRWMHHRKLKNDEEVDDEAVYQSEMDDPWVNFSSPNSLKEVAQFYMKEDMDKSTRDLLAELDLDVIRDSFEEVVNYCAGDVLTTHQIYTKVLPEFLEVCPHPVSFAALRHMSSGILPTDSTWQDYIQTSEKMYIEGRNSIEAKLNLLAEEAVKLRFDLQRVKSDPWLSQLDWTITEQKVKKDGEPYKNQKLPGYPAWYRELYSSKHQKLNLTIRARLTPLLLRLTWEGHPVVWHDHYGWCFKADFEDFERLRRLNYIDLPHFTETFGLSKEEFSKRATSGEFHKLSKLDEARFFQEELKDTPVYFRVPNSVGPDHRTTLLMAKEFSTPFEKNILKSDNPLAQEAINLNASCSYWISSRERIMSQFVVEKPTESCSLIVPQIVPMGTVTRRAVEKTWLTASNAKKSRIGSELKSKIKAPEGYCFVGADVDSEELWIASLVGDSMFKIHGGTAIGWMTLEGSKNEGTDLHSKTANILGISRNEAKVFNYGRIYGAGVKFAATLLKKFNPGLSQEECKKRADMLYAETKGSAGKYQLGKSKHKLWFGGSESVLFNELERIAHNDFPRTPVLGASITKALNKSNLKQNSFLTSRVNWAIQSSGVDYLHLLCVSMNYLINKYGIDARLAISVHDEIRYLVKEQDKFKAARALQISNIWTRAIFSENLGMKDLPQSCAFFSAVDIDSVLRKEVDMDCITPSHPVAIPPGESLDISKLLEIEESLFDVENDLQLDGFASEEMGSDNAADSYTDKSNTDTTLTYDDPEFKEAILSMQICSSEDVFKKKWRNFRDTHKDQFRSLKKHSASSSMKQSSFEMIQVGVDMVMQEINNSNSLKNQTSQPEELPIDTKETDNWKAKGVLNKRTKPATEKISVEFKVMEEDPEAIKKRKLAKAETRAKFKKFDEDDKLSTLQGLIGKDGRLTTATKPAVAAKKTNNNMMINDFPSDFNFNDYGNTITTAKPNTTKKQYDRFEGRKTAKKIMGQDPKG
ncbi:hypothetical protein WICPIJ_008566, partial [Wickerhamomyces pijperi]